jgi:hypothetical protein
MPLCDNAHIRTRLKGKKIHENNTLAGPGDGPDDDGIPGPR